MARMKKMTKDEERKNDVTRESRELTLMFFYRFFPVYSRDSRAELRLQPSRAGYPW
jgi:hypothetical protein